MKPSLAGDRSPARWRQITPRAGDTSVTAFRWVSNGGLLRPDPSQLQREKESCKPQPQARKYDDTTPGTGAEATQGAHVTVHYTGWLFSDAAPGNRGAKFDSSKDRSDRSTFCPALGHVIMAGTKVCRGRKSRYPRSGDPAGAWLRRPRVPAASFRPTRRWCFEVELFAVQESSRSVASGWFPK